MTKEILMKTVEELPDSFEVDDLIERLLFIAGVEEGLKDLREGNTVTQEEMEKIVEGWRK